MTQPIVLEARGVAKHFGGVIALRGVSFDLRAGEVHALCGENGAGKSTLIKLLAGVHPHRSYDGEILLDGTPARFRSTRDAERAGIAVIHQELSLFRELTVAENLLLGVLPRRRSLIDWVEVRARAQRLLRDAGIALDVDARVGSLGIGGQQLVEIAKALSRSPRILVLDEPTAALAQHEIEVLLRLVRELRSRGVACIYISHKLDEVFALADRITVLRDGAAQRTLAVADTNEQEIIALMVGRRIEELYPTRAANRGQPRLEVRGLSVAERSGTPPRLKDLRFAVHAGEVFGIGGLMGAGRSELLLHLLGLWGHRQSGEVALDGAPLNADAPRETMRRGLRLVTEDRKRSGLVLGMGVGFNLTLSSLARLRRGPFLDAEAEARDCRDMVEQLHIKCASLALPVATLSGGNQQKVVLGKVLLAAPSVLLLDEPTRGVDVGAKREIYELIAKLAAAGKAIVLVSSELSELLGMSDRILMLHDGAVGGLFERSEATQARLLAAAMGRTWQEAA